MYGAMQVGAVATAAGAGGGALFVPLFSAFLHFSEFSSSHVSALLQMHRCLLSNAIKVDCLCMLACAVADAASWAATCPNKYRLK